MCNFFIEKSRLYVFMTVLEELILSRIVSHASLLDLNFFKILIDAKEFLTSKRKVLLLQLLTKTSLKHYRMPFHPLTSISSYFNLIDSLPLHCYYLIIFNDLHIPRVCVSCACQSMRNMLNDGRTEKCHNIQ